MIQAAIIGLSPMFRRISAMSPSTNCILALSVKVPRLDVAVAVATTCRLDGEIVAATSGGKDSFAGGRAVAFPHLLQKDASLGLDAPQ